MALSVAQYAQCSNWFATTSPQTITGVAWSSGDIVVVIGGTESNSGGALLTPTNANLTFSLQASQATGGSSEAGIYVWSATAGSSQTAQTISMDDSSAVLHYGLGCWVITGAPTGVANATGNLTEAAFSITVSAGSVVVYGLMDFNATNPPGKTPLAGGGGTTTERLDQGNGTTYAQYLYEEVGAAAGTFSFGPNNYTSLQVAQIIIEILAPAGGGGADIGAMGGGRRFFRPGRGPKPRWVRHWDNHEWSAAIESGSVDATATPAEIAATVAMDAAVVSAGSTATPVELVAVASLDAVTTSAGSTPTPVEIIATAALDAATTSAGSTVTPTEIVAVAVMDAVAAGSAATTAPAEIVAAAAMDAVAASAGSSPLPAAVVAAATLDTPTLSAGSTPTPAAIVAIVAMDAVILSAGSTATPAEIVANAVMDAVAASGSGSETVTPAAIAAVVTIDAVVLSAGSTPTPAAIVAVATMDAVAASASSTTAPAVLVASAVMDAVVVTVGANPQPATIIAVAVMDAVTVPSGATVTPAAIAAAVTMDPVFVIGVLLILIGPLTTATIRHPRTTVDVTVVRATATIRHPRTSVLTPHPRTSTTVRHPRTTEEP